MCTNAHATRFFPGAQSRLLDWVRANWKELETHALIRKIGALALVPTDVALDATDPASDAADGLSASALAAIPPLVLRPPPDGIDISVASSGGAAVASAAAAAAAASASASASASAAASFVPRAWSDTVATGGSSVSVRRSCISELFDPRNALFAFVFKFDRVFPAREMRSPDWLAFFAALGMKTKLTGRGVDPRVDSAHWRLWRSRACFFFLFVLLLFVALCPILCFSS
jgi:hypothetical protein